MEQGIWTREFLISPELCGMDGRLGVLGGLTLFQALAAEHAEQIGVGFAAMALTVCRFSFAVSRRLADSIFRFSISASRALIFSKLSASS